MLIFGTQLWLDYAVAQIKLFKPLITKGNKYAADLIQNMKTIIGKKSL